MTQRVDYDAVLLDIEGTTTPVAFVYDVLFPYARQKLADYLADHWNDPGVRADIGAVVEHLTNGPDDAPKDLARTVADHDRDVPAFRTAIVDYLRLQMENDQKLTPLKSLQGRIWRAGYEDGQLQAPVFPDVPDALEAFDAQARPVYIYSSGSVDAQKLLFGHTDHGDLRGWIDGYFDTETGSKLQADSYRTIADAVDRDPANIIFVTDHLAEADAADAAGLQVAVSIRPGNAGVGEHDFPEITTLGGLLGDRLPR